MELHLNPDGMPVMEDTEQLHKFILQLCYRPAFTKRTIPDIIDNMQYDIDRMMIEIRSGNANRLRKNLLYARIDGRKRMIADMNIELNNLNKEAYEQTTNE